VAIATINAWNHREVVLAQLRRYHNIHFTSREKCTTTSKFILVASDKFLIFTANGAT
jgi:hypothetical protein